MVNLTASKFLLASLNGREQKDVKKMISQVAQLSLLRWENRKKRPKNGKENAQIVLEL